MNNTDETLEGDDTTTGADAEAHPLAAAEDRALTPAVAHERADDEGAPIEVWAERKGMLPRMLPGPAGERLNPHYWKFAAVQATSDGAPVTEEEFDRAVEEQGKHIIR